MRGIHSKNVATARHRRYNHDSEAFGYRRSSLGSRRYCHYRRFTWGVQFTLGTLEGPRPLLKQLTWLGIGLGLAAAFAIPDYRTTESVAYVAFIAVLALLVAVLVRVTVLVVHAVGWLWEGYAFSRRACQNCDDSLFVDIFQTNSVRRDIRFDGFLNHSLSPVLWYYSRRFFAGWQSEYLADPLGSLARMMAAEHGARCG